MARVGKDCSIPWVFLGIQLPYKTAGLKLRQVRKFSSRSMWLKPVSRTNNCTKGWKSLTGRSKSHYPIVWMATGRQIGVIPSFSFSSWGSPDITCSIFKMGLGFLFFVWGFFFLFLFFIFILEGIFFRQGFYLHFFLLIPSFWVFLRSEKSTPVHWRYNSHDLTLKKPAAQPFILVNIVKTHVPPPYRKLNYLPDQYTGV